MGDSYVLGTTSYLKTANLGASYDFGPVKLFGEIARSQLARDTVGVSLLPEPTADGYLLGATVPVGPGLIRMSYAQVKLDTNIRNPLLAQAPEPKSQKYAIGYVHNLSKRTALYATYAYLKNKNGLDITVGGHGDHFPGCGVERQELQRLRRGYPPRLLVRCRHRPASNGTN